MQANKLPNRYYGCPIFELDGENWVLGTTRKFQKIARQRIKGSLWDFFPEYLNTFCQKVGIITSKESIREIQSRPGAQQILSKMLGPHLEEFVDHILSDDEFESYLPGKDYDRCTIHTTKYIPGLPVGFGPKCFPLESS